MMTLNIPDDIEQQLKIIANNKQLAVSEFVLSLLTTALKQQEKIETVSCFDLMQDGLGCIDDAPSDLSVNKNYLSGYGK
ncbi:MAG: hypothetical protein EXR80_02855 [Methylococcales bacterium]|nr:hypothetical protein [Methylococcales bacterium]